MEINGLIYIIVGVFVAIFSYSITLFNEKISITRFFIFIILGIIFIMIGLVKILRNSVSKPKKQEIKQTQNISNGQQPLVNPHVKYCPQCGNTLRHFDRFCYKCGNRIFK
jgi:hypothetical protein